MREEERKRRKRERGWEKKKEREEEREGRKKRRKKEKNPEKREKNKFFLTIEKKKKKKETDLVLVGPSHGPDQEARDDSLVLRERLCLEEVPDFGVGEEPWCFFSFLLIEFQKKT